VSLQARCVANVKEKYFTTEYRPVGVLLKYLLNDLFKIKLQLKYRKNKIYSYLTVNFDTGLRAKKYINVHLKFGTVKNYHEMRSAHWHCTLSILCCYIHVDVISLTLSKSLYSGSVGFKRTDNFGSVFPNRLHRRIDETKLPTHISFLFSVFCFSYHF
jgi:hypothetical protein